MRALRGQQVCFVIVLVPSFSFSNLETTRTITKNENDWHGGVALFSVRTLGVIS
jgi:hypothetical protein